MNKKHVTWMVIATFAGLALTFNNCSKVNVTELPTDPAPTSVDQQGSQPAPEEEDSYIPTRQEQEAVLEVIATTTTTTTSTTTSSTTSTSTTTTTTTMPVIIVQPPVPTTTTTTTTTTTSSTTSTTMPPTSEPQPVTDLIDHPELFEVYKCPNSEEKVMICHFPQGTNPPITECVGNSAVSTHFGHSRTVVDSSGTNKTLNDYLGPCR